MKKQLVIIMSVVIMLSHVATASARSYTEQEIKDKSKEYYEACLKGVYTAEIRPDDVPYCTCFKDKIAKSMKEGKRPDKFHASFTCNREIPAS